jgi:hypothetical protein
MATRKGGKIAFDNPNNLKLMNSQLFKWVIQLEMITKLFFFKPYIIVD